MDRTQLMEIKQRLDMDEKNQLYPWACRSSQAVRRKPDENIALGHRQNFSLDSDRILHSLAYSRYIDKTQVFYLIKNDHITHRVLHVQFVSKIARTIGRLLRLNEDLIEAIALGHDIGHTPFGHDGESFLSEISEKYGIGPFLHNIQGVRFLERIEKKGQGWNLSLQVLDGILCHDGELHSQALRPSMDKDFSVFDTEIINKLNNPNTDLHPMTLEGCVVRMADTISYIGRDIEDAIRLGLIKRDDLPDDCTQILGNTNGTIIYTLVEDLVNHSLDKPYISFSAKVGQALKDLKAFNQRYIYTSNRVKEQSAKIRLMLELLFGQYFQDLEQGNENSDIFKEFLEGMSTEYRHQVSRAEMVRDFIAGMTDDYFLERCQENLFPQVRSTHFMI